MTHKQQILNWKRTLQEERKRQGLSYDSVTYLSRLKGKDNVRSWENIEERLPNSAKLLAWADALGYEFEMVKKTSDKGDSDND